MQILSPQTKKLLQRGLLWYKGLQTRERWLLVGLVVVVLAVGVQRGYLLYQDHKQRLVDRMESAQNELLWLEDLRLQLEQLRHQGAVQLGEQQLLDTLHGVAAELQIKVEVSAVEVDRLPFVRVSWEGQKLSNFMHYLSALKQRGASVKSLDVVRANNQLSANARVEG